MPILWEPCILGEVGRLFYDQAISKTPVHEPTILMISRIVEALLEVFNDVDNVEGK